jgi:hypothetical protein
MLCTGDATGRFEKLKAYADRADIPPESRQYALYMAAGVLGKTEPARALALYKQAVATAPDSPFVETNLKDAVDRMEKRIGGRAR